ncbi:unnamed protein product [Protopolystoma xenopodis]|uniref:Uncharacterized protein n=1 Tax=Protopolystoma xenopodis TaxID=117903 RepID=A0A3S5FET6_9PLAT|nr:unnamed protein product [Protopolystoma xenopodis]
MSSCSSGIENKSTYNANTRGSHSNRTGLNTTSSTTSVANSTLNNQPTDPGLEANCTSTLITGLDNQAGENGVVLPAATHSATCLAGSTSVNIVRIPKPILQPNLSCPPSNGQSQQTNTGNINYQPVTGSIPASDEGNQPLNSQPSDKPMHHSAGLMSLESSMMMDSNSVATSSIAIRVDTAADEPCLLYSTNPTLRPANVGEHSVGAHEIPFDSVDMSRHLFTGIMLEPSPAQFCSETLCSSAASGEQECSNPESLSSTNNGIAVQFSKCAQLQNVESVGSQHYDRTPVSSENTCIFSQTSLISPSSFEPGVSQFDYLYFHPYICVYTCICV